GEISEPLKLAICIPEGTTESENHLKTDEWFTRDQNIACERIAHGISRIMDLPIADPFLVPIDVSLYPAYAFLVDYPIDLNTIKKRLENNFYRNGDAVLFDVFHIAKNAEKFYKEGSIIIIQAQLVTYLCSTLTMYGKVTDLIQLHCELQQRREKGIVDIQPETVQILEDWNILCKR
ncbi:unnamed protein product, partial [Meganyctiphanes norvegica]